MVFLVLRVLHASHILSVHQIPLQRLPRPPLLHHAFPQRRVLLHQLPHGLLQDPLLLVAVLQPDLPMLDLRLSLLNQRLRVLQTRPPRVQRQPQPVVLLGH